MFGWLFWFWLDVKLAFEPNLLFIIDRQVQKFSQVIQLPLHVGIEESAVAFAPAPKHIARSVQFMRDLQRLLYLRCRISKDVGIATCRRAVHIPGMSKE